MNTFRLPPHTMPMSMRGFSWRSNSTSLGLPEASTRFASSITAASAAPPPTVPTMVPSARNMSFAVAWDGTEPMALTIVARAQMRPALRSRMSSS